MTARVVNVRTYQALQAWVEVFDAHARETRNPIMRLNDALVRFRIACGRRGLVVSAESARLVYLDLATFGVFERFQRPHDETGKLTDEFVPYDPTSEPLTRIYLWANFGELRAWLETARSVNDLNVEMLVDHDRDLVAGANRNLEPHSMRGRDVAGALWRALLLPMVLDSVRQLDALEQFVAGLPRRGRPLSVASAVCPFCARRIFVGGHDLTIPAVKFLSGAAGATGFEPDAALGYAHVTCFNSRVVPRELFASLTERAAGVNAFGRVDYVDPKNMLG